MFKIHSSINAMEVHNLKNVLEANGIRCEIRGEHRRGVIGEVPIGEAFVELWLAFEDDVEKARKVLDEALTRKAGPWTCPKCNEKIEAGFDQCWSCRTERSS